jgi:hypothetical protein
MDNKKRTSTILYIFIGVIVVILIFFILKYLINIFQYNSSYDVGIKTGKEQTQKETEKDNTIIKFKVKNGNDYLYINEYGYIKGSYDKLVTPIIELIGLEVYDFSEKVDIDIPLQIYSAIEENKIVSNVDIINMTDLKDILLYSTLENKTIHIGDKKDISTKITYMKKIMEQTKGKKGTIFVNDINKTYFREDI